MKAPHEKLVEHWRAQGIRLASGATTEDIAAFQVRYGVTLPADFKAYFLRVNGMIQLGNDSEDEHGFSFWPLWKLKDLRALRDDEEVEVPDVNLMKNFVFADYLQWSWAYAINLDADAATWGQIVPVGALTHTVIAPSFSGFVDLYVADASELYPPPP
jgi:hypothetical protein